MTVYENLLKICDVKGISITRLCVQATGNKGNLATWKNNNGHMRSDYLLKCANILNCSTDFILGHSLNKNENDIVEKPNQEISYEPHIIAYIDVLGTKSLLSKQPQKYLLWLSSVANKINETITKIKSDINFLNTEIKYKMFSDNIVFAIQFDNKTEIIHAEQMIALISMIQFALALDSIPIRGSITKGDLYIDERFVMGEGLEEAHELESKNAFYQRVIVNPVIAEKVLRNGTISADYRHSISYDFDAYPFLNYLTFSSSEDDIKKHYTFLSENALNSNDTKAHQKNNWAKVYHNRFCTLNNYKKYIFGDVSSVNTSNDLNIEKVYDNHGVIGHTHAPVTIINGAEKKLSKQEIALLETFSKLDAFKQARLLTYLSELEKED